MQIAELLSGLKYNSFGVNLRGYVQGVASDSRRICFGYLFVCLKGTRRDGHEFAEVAMKRGAVAVVSERFIPGIPCIVVKNTRVANAVIWDNYYGNPSRRMKMIAVTGTNGKTSTATYLAAILNCQGIKTASIGTLGICFGKERLDNQSSEVGDAFAAMTTPDPEFLYSSLKKLAESGAEAVVMEVSSHAIAQKKVFPIKFELGVFTNLSHEHLDFHCGMEDYYKTKASLFSQCRMAVVGCDCGYGRRLASELGEKAVRADCSEAASLKINGEGISYELELNSEKFKIRSSTTGIFTLQNTMLAAKSAYMLGASVIAVEKGIDSVKYVSGRMERITDSEKNKINVFIDYAHTPDALASALRCIRSVAGGERITVVFGCGGDRDKSKRPEMGRISVNLSDRVIVTSDNPRSERRENIISDIIRGIESPGKVRVIVDRKAALEYAVKTAVKNEYVLVCGKGHESYEIDECGCHPFSERNIILSALSERD